MAGAPRSKAPKANVLSYRQARPDSLVLITGTEDYLASLSIRAIRAQVKARWPEVEESEVDASSYVRGDLLTLASPSLFSSQKLILAQQLSTMSDDFLTDALSYLQAPEPDVVLILRHSGGQRGKKLLDALKKSGVTHIDCAPLKKDAEKTAFVDSELSRVGRRMERSAQHKLVSTLGSSLPDLAAALNQLLSDVEGTLTDAHIERYYGDRSEATAFNVADAALKGQAAPAMIALRNALATGVDPVPIVASLAIRLRQVASVADSHLPAAQLASSVGMAPWQVEQARRDSRRFTQDQLIRAIQAVAEADYEVKGGSRDPIFALERAILTVAG